MYVFFVKMIFYLLISNMTKLKSVTSRGSATYKLLPRLRKKDSGGLLGGDQGAKLDIFMRSCSLVSSDIGISNWGVIKRPNRVVTN